MVISMGVSALPHQSQPREEPEEPPQVVSISPQVQGGKLRPREGQCLAQVLQVDGPDGNTGSEVQASGNLPRLSHV